jgi:hypothetical protein
VDLTARLTTGAEPKEPSHDFTPEASAEREIRSGNATLCEVRATRDAEIKGGIKICQDTPEEQAPLPLLSHRHFEGKSANGPTKHTQPLGFAAGLHLYLMYFDA